MISNIFLNSNELECYKLLNTYQIESLILFKIT